MEKIYKPSFRWRENEAGEHSIYDREKTVAAFYPGTCRLPENPSAAFRPVSLHNLRLTPEGPAMIAKGEACGPLCLSWRKHLIYNMEIDLLRVDDKDPSCFRLFVITRDTAIRPDINRQNDYKPGNLKEETWLELTYDSAIQSYVYDIRTRLKIRPGSEDFVLSRDNRGLEFGDILPAGANDCFPPRGKKKYTHILYMGTDRKLYNRPQNRHLGPEKKGIFYSPGGFLAFAAEKQGNPAVEFLGDTGSLAVSEICWAMYDVHFKFRREAQAGLIEKGRPLEIHYRFFSLGHEKAEKMLAMSSPDPVLEHPMVRCPVFIEDGINFFEPSDEYRRPSDKWFWQMSDTSCYWDWNRGCRKRGSLAISREEKENGGEGCTGMGSRGKSCWELYAIGKTSSITGRYEIRAMVKTLEVKGRAYMAWQIKNICGETESIEPSGENVEISESVSGTTDWKEIRIETGENRNGNLGGLYLVMEGSGRCWFDEVQVRQIKEEGPEPGLKRDS